MTIYNDTKIKWEMQELFSILLMWFCGAAFMATDTTKEMHPVGYISFYHL